MHETADVTDEGQVAASPGEFFPTGDERVDEALQSLRFLAGLPVQQHAHVIDGVHRALRDRLAGEEG